MMKETDEDNIIKFPRKHLGDHSDLQSPEDVLKQIEEYKKSFADDLSEILSSHIFGELARSGINFETQIDDLFPSMVLVSEAIKSLQLKASNVEHPLQEFADDAYQDLDDQVDKSDLIDYNLSTDETDFDGE